MCDMVVQDMVVQVQACLPNVIFLLHDSYDYVNVKCMMVLNNAIVIYNNDNDK